MELEDFENLVNFAVSIEHGFLFNQLSKDAADCPNINTKAILLLTQQNFWSSIPQSLDFMGKCFDGNSESSGQSKVSYFQISIFIDKQVLGFEIPVDDPSGVAKVDSIDQLEHE